MWCSLAVPVLQGTVRNRNEVQKAPMSSPIGAVWRWAPKLNERAAAARSEECDNDTQTAMMGHEIIYNTTLGQRGTTPRQFLSHVFAAAVLRCFPVRRVSQNCGIGHMKISGAKKGRGGGGGGWTKVNWCRPPPPFFGLLLPSQLWPIPSMSRRVINCAKLCLSHPFNRIKWIRQ